MTWLVIGVAAVVVVLLVLLILGGMQGNVESVLSVDPATHILDGNACYVCRPIVNAHSRLLLWVAARLGHAFPFELKELGASGYVWDGTVFVTSVTDNWRGCPTCRSLKIQVSRFPGRSGHFTTCLNCAGVFETPEPRSAVRVRE